MWHIGNAGNCWYIPLELFVCLPMWWLYTDILCMHAKVPASAPLCIPIYYAYYVYLPIPRWQVECTYPGVAWVAELPCQPFTKFRILTNAICICICINICFRICICICIWYARVVGLPCQPFTKFQILTNAICICIYIQKKIGTMR